MLACPDPLSGWSGSTCTCYLSVKRPHPRSGCAATLCQQLSDPQTHEFGLHRIAGAGRFLKFEVRQEYVCLHGLLIFFFLPGNNTCNSCYFLLFLNYTRKLKRKFIFQK